MASNENVTLIKGAVHNPSEPRHFMEIVPTPVQQIARVSATIRD